MELKINRDNLPILNQFSEPDFVDCVLKIEGLASDGDYYTFHMSASFEGERVGADVRVLKGIKAGFNSEMNIGLRMGSIIRAFSSCVRVRKATG